MSMAQDQQTTTTPRPVGRSSRQQASRALVIPGFGPRKPSGPDAIRCCFSLFRNDRLVRTPSEKKAHRLDGAASLSDLGCCTVKRCFSGYFLRIDLSTEIQEGEDSLEARLFGSAVQRT
ncbi:unnamed protein product, partial [Ectocarpus sp. 12 AP-2014]